MTNKYTKEFNVYWRRAKIQAWSMIAFGGLKRVAWKGWSAARKKRKPSGNGWYYDDISTLQQVNRQLQQDKLDLERELIKCQRAQEKNNG